MIFAPELETSRLNESMKIMTTKQSWKPVTIGGVTGILMGAGAMYATKLNTPKLDGSVEPADQPQAVNEAATHDELSFGEAFQTARAELGPGGVFRWHGNIYNTYTAEEWNQLSQVDKETLAKRVDAEVSPSDIDTNEIARAESHQETVEDVTVAEVASATSEEELSGVNAGTATVASVDETETVQTTAEKPAENPAEEDNDVRVVGFGHVQLPDGHYVAVEEVDINGQRVAVVDVDNDGMPDIAMSDINHNQQADEGEIIDLHTGEALSFTNTVGDDEMYAGNDASMPEVDPTLL